jgi:hypothetical protein
LIYRPKFGKIQLTRAFASIVIVFLTALAHVFCLIQPAYTGSIEKPLHIIFSSAMVSEMNENDAKAALDVLARKIAKAEQIDSTPTTAIRESNGPLQRDLENGEGDLVALRIEDYFAQESRGILEPAFVGLRGGNWAESFVVLVHRQSGIQDLSGLRGKRLITFLGGRAGLSTTWLNSLLLEDRLPELNEYFGDVQSAYKVSRTILPVFFKQADACLITKSGFDTVIQLNPQVGRDLLIIRQSSPVLPSLLCLRSSIERGLKDRIIEVLENLQADSSGKQVLLLFKLERLIPCTGAHIEESRNLMNRYRRMKGISTSMSKTKS